MTPEIKQRIKQIRRGEVPVGYIRTASGVAPANWTRYTFGDIYTERKEPGSEDLPFLMVSIHSGVSDGEVDEEELPKKVKRIKDKSQYKKAASGDLVFNMMRAWQGAIGTVRTTGMVSPAYIVAQPNDKVHPLFMDYYTKTPRMIHQIDRQSYGVTDFRKRLYWDSFAPISCTLPPIEEQQKIADILTTENKVIELKEKRLAEKQRQKKYLMQQLLTGKKRLPGFSGEWGKERLGNCVSMCSGGTPDTKNERYYGSDYIWISIKDMTSAGKYICSSERGLTEEGFLNCSAKLFPKGTILFAMYASIGECSIAEIECCSSQAILGIEPDSKLNNEFLYYFLSNAKEHFKSFGQASSQPNLNKDIVQSIVVQLPKFEEQTAIAEVLSTADREIDLLRQDIEQEKRKKKALMQLLLTGIVRVTV